jgi:hypothetical protein
MQAELDSLNLPRPVQILGVNEEGFESGNTTTTTGRDIPWLQDVTGQDVWEVWDPVYRDVIVLGPNNEWVGAFNLTTNNLSDPDNYDALLQLFVDAASL